MGPGCSALHLLPTHPPRGCSNYINLGSFLIKPVQRVMRYPLLLMELLSATPDGHPDKAPLAAAVHAVKEINVNINEYKRRKDLGEAARWDRVGGSSTAGGSRTVAVWGWKLQQEWSWARGGCSRGDIGGHRRW